LRTYGNHVVLHSVPALRGSGSFALSGVFIGNPFAMTAFSSYRIIARSLASAPMVEPDG
jgi:hypothetical protein